MNTLYLMSKNLFKIYAGQAQHSQSMSMQKLFKGIIIIFNLVYYYKNI